MQVQRSLVILFCFVVVATISAVPALASTSTPAQTPAWSWSWLTPTELQRYGVLQAELAPGWRTLRALPRGTRIDPAVQVGPAWVAEWREAAGIIEHAAGRGLRVPLPS